MPPGVAQAKRHTSNNTAQAHEHPMYLEVILEKNMNFVKLIFWGPQICFEQ